MRLLGALLVVISGAWTGCSALAAARCTTRMAERAEAMTRLFSTLVCSHRLPLPEAVARLHEEYPAWFPDEESLRASLRNESFGKTWAVMIRSVGLPRGVEDILLPLGRELSAGEEPERCFERTGEELRAFRANSLSRERETLRLCPALGLCAGLLLAIVLL